MGNRIIFIVGPTASGKSETAVALAKKINGEIITCDSMQVYKGMDILTAKPSSGLRKRVRHHLLSVVAPSREYNVSKYRADAVKKIKQIIKKGKVPVFAGGTGLYMSVVVDGIFKTGRIDKGIRKGLYRLALSRGGNYLFNKLKKVDPEAAGKIHPNDTKRLIRALEVFEATGKPISSLQKQRKGLAAAGYDVMIFGLDLDRGALYERINERVDKMLKRGLTREVKKLLKVKLSETARFAIGINEIKGYLEGDYGLDEALDKMKHNSRLYAKRQLTWFRKDKRISWVKVRNNDMPAKVAEMIMEKF